MLSLILIGLSCSEEQPIIFKETLTAEFHIDVANSNRLLYSKYRKLIIPKNLDLGNRQIKKVDFDSITVSIKTTSLINLEGTLITFRRETQNPSLITVEIDSPIHVKGGESVDLRLALDSDQLEFIKSTLQTDMSILVLLVIQYNGTPGHAEILVSTEATTRY